MIIDKSPKDLLKEGNQHNATLDDVFRNLTIESDVSNNA